MQRYDYIDIAKGIGILLVVWGHIMLTGVSHQLVYAFHMPVFFLISGMLFQRGKSKSFGSFLKKRSLRLLLPYAIYSVATWAVWAAFRYIRHDDVASYFDPLLQTFIAKGSGAYMVHNSALWFIPCLFVTELMFYFISKLKEVWVFVLCLTGPVLSFALGRLYGDEWWFLLPWNFDAALIALFFFYLGNIFVEKLSHTAIVSYAQSHTAVMLITMLCSFGVLLSGSLYFGECSMGSSSYQCPGWVFMLRAIVGCGFLIVLSLLLGNWNSRILGYIKWCGVKSLDIMCLHIPIKGVVLIAAAMLLQMQVDDISNSEMYSAVVFIPTVIVITILIIGIEKFFRKKDAPK